MKVVLENLTKQFASRQKKGEVVTAVNNFNFVIPDGQLIGLLRKKHHAEPDQRSGNADNRKDLFRG